MQTEKLKSVWNKYKTIIVSVIAVVLALGFVGSILGAVFSGGEFVEKADKMEVKGLLQLNESDYSTDYLSGDKFLFDKEKAKITLIAKDPAIDHVVKIEDLPASEYGFSVNGEGEIYDTADKITMSADVKSVSVVSKFYPNLKVNIPVNVVATSGIEFKKSLTMEAETAKLYKDNVLIKNEEKQTLPDADKPYNSAAGTPAGKDCSGGACLRNLGTQNMKVQFDIISTKDVEASLTIKYCKRTDGKTFGEYFVVKVNGKENKEIAAVKTEVGEDYFTPADLQTVTLTLKRGINTITFESGPTVGTQNPVNLDALLITCAESVIGVFPA